MGLSEGQTAKSILVEWANDQDHWVRTVVSDVIELKAQASDSRIKEYYQQFLAEKELSADERRNVPPIPSQTLAGKSDHVLLLDELKEVAHVNALSDGQSIVFNPCLTILFGENGAGKTGYVRILKRMASVRAVEPILPNLRDHSNPNAAPEAKVTYSFEGTAKTINWTGQQGIHPLTSIDIFDSRFAKIHVDEDLTYTYTPGELSLFPHVQRGVEGLRILLETEAKRLADVSNPFRERIARNSNLYSKIESLGASTDLAELRKLSQVSEEEQFSLGKLEEEINALKGNSPEREQRAASLEIKYWENICESIEKLCNFDLGNYSELLKNKIKNISAYEKISKQAFMDEQVPGILSDHWRDFIYAAEKYLQTTESHSHFPSEGDSCLYCRQPLHAVAVRLIKKYRDYTNSAVASLVREDERSLKALTEVISRMDLDGGLRSTQERISSLGTSNPKFKVLAMTRDVLTEAKGLKAALEKSQEFSWQQDIGSLKNSINEEISALKTTIDALKARLEERQKELASREIRLLDIRSRLWLQQNLSAIERFVNEKKWAYQANIHAAKFRGILRGLTEASKRASEQLLNQDFERRFKKECDNLRCPPISLEFPGRQGQVTRHKFVADNQRLEEVLSEGEQKVVALADFLAEAELKSSGTPIIFDDPVNSLDYKRLEYVVGRIVQLSEQRQVIIFTHNIWFAAELLTRFDKNREKCSYYDVEGSGEQKGVVTKGSHPRADTYSTLRGRLNKLLQDASTTTGETRSAIVEKAYEHLRSFCEVAIEGELFQRVVERYRPNVMMTGLPKIKYERLKPAVDIIFPVYEKACRYIGSHSQPMETLNIRPSIEDLKKDWDQVQAAITAYKA